MINYENNNMNNEMNQELNYNMNNNQMINNQYNNMQYNNDQNIIRMSQRELENKRKLENAKSKIIIVNALYVCVNLKLGIKFLLYPVRMCFIMIV